MSTGTDKRISARRGRVVNLDVDFYHDGELADPYAIRRVDIYKEQVLPHNLLEVIVLPALAETAYPLPVERLGTGQYQLPYMVPVDLPVPGVYQDVWYYYESDPCTVGTDPCDIDDPSLAPLLLGSCHRFWAYPDEWWTDDRLQSINFGFEPLSQRFNTPESRYLEVGLMPLPLYDFNYNLVVPIIPYVKATITVTTRNCELLVDSEPMDIGIRQGSYRTNPFVVKWRLDTSRFLIGTYRYRIVLQLPNGVTQASRWFILVIE